MKIKICFNHEIHVISKIPDTFAAFVSLLNSKFHSQLPAHWTLQYTDSDGDNILINDEKDYEEFTNPDPSASVSAAKVFVVPVESFRPPQEAIKSQIVEKIEEKQDDDYQVIQKEEEQVVKPEEVLPKEEEKPVVQEVQEVVLETPQETPQPSTDSGNEVEVQEPEKKVEEEEEKIEQPVKEEVIPTESKDQKILVDLDDLAKIITNMIDSRLPQVAEAIKSQLSFEIRPPGESKLLDESVEVNPYECSILQNQVLKPVEPQVKHFGISCSGCQMMPIVGIRYKCTVCPRFDYCENCEESCEHSHNFVKMKQRDLLDIFRPNPQVVIQAEPVLPPVVYNPVPVENNYAVAEPVEKKKKERLSRAEKKEQKKMSQNYFKNLQEKAQKLQKCFPKEDFEILCAYVNGAPEDMSLEELVENFKH